MARNLLGASRAEADTAMLESAFVETTEYRALTTSEDFHFVVGRRGTGKSALFHRVAHHYRSIGKAFVLHCEVPKEHDAVNVHGTLKQAGCDYKRARALCRLAWRGYILGKIGLQLVDHYKAERCEHVSWLRDYLEKWSSALSLGAYGYIARLLQTCTLSELHKAPSEMAALVEI